MNAFPRLISCLIPAVLFAGPFDPARAADPSPPPRSPVYLSGWASEADIDDNPGRLEDESHSFAFGLGFGTRLRRYLELGGDVFGLSAEFDNTTLTAPVLGTISDEMDLSVGALLLKARGVRPLGWFEPFLGGGLGWGRAKMTVHGSLLGIPGIAEEETDTGMLFEYAFGAGFVLSKALDLVLQYRDIRMKADFDDLSTGEVDIGGALYAIELRFHLGELKPPSVP